MGRKKLLNKVEISLSTKLAIINDSLHKKITQRQLALKYRISLGAINRILRFKDAILKFKNTPEIIQKKTYRFRTPKYPQIEEYLWQWIWQCKQRNIFIDGNCLKCKALELAETWNLPDFKASNGWLEKFKSRFNSLACDKFEDASLKEYFSAEFLKESSETLKQYEARDVFCAYESGIFWRGKQPANAATHLKSCADGSFAESRLTLLMCCNALGEKEPLFFVGNGDEKVEDGHIPRQKSSATLFAEFGGGGGGGQHFFFASQPQSWFTPEIFDAWLTAFNARMAARSRHVLLLLEGLLLHPTNVALSHTKILYISSKSTWAHPFATGIARAVKRNYFCSLTQSPHSAAASFPLNLADAISRLIFCWNATSCDVIKKSFDFFFAFCDSVDAKHGALIVEKSMLSTFVFTAAADDADDAPYARNTLCLDAPADDEDRLATHDVSGLLAQQNADILASLSGFLFEDKTSKRSAKSLLRLHAPPNDAADDEADERGGGVPRPLLLHPPLLPFTSIEGRDARHIDDEPRFFGVAPNKLKLLAAFATTFMKRGGDADAAQNVR